VARGEPRDAPEDAEEQGAEAGREDEEIPVAEEQALPKSHVAEERLVIEDVLAAAKRPRLKNGSRVRLVGEPVITGAPVEHRSERVYTAAGHENAHGYHREVAREEASPARPADQDDGHDRQEQHEVELFARDCSDTARQGACPKGPSECDEPPGRCQQARVEAGEHHEG
jgi:hypothetical protein